MAKKTTPTSEVGNDSNKPASIKPSPPNKDGAFKYLVTALAGNWVAGKRSPGEGNALWLTPKQAETPLRNGEIEAG